MVWLYSFVGGNGVRQHLEVGYSCYANGSVNAKIKGRIKKIKQITQKNTKF